MGYLHEFSLSLDGNMNGKILTCGITPSVHTLETNSSGYTGCIVAFQPRTRVIRLTDIAIDASPTSGHIIECELMRTMKR
jgi:hypothetical protein